MGDASQAQSWHGIVILHSTREEVKQKFGPSGTPEERLYDLYNLSDEVAFVMYSSGPCSEGRYSGWNVPRNTVVNISVAPKTELRVADMQLEEKRYKKKTGQHVRGFIYYFNEEEGITVEASEGKVTKIYYYPPTKDDHLRCPDNPRQVPAEDGTMQTFDKIDVYFDIPFEKEKGRLDYLALQLQNTPDMQGFIIVYARRRARAGEAKARAERAKKYLVNERGIESRRILTMDGGHREELMVELYLGPRGAAAPTPVPTVDPNEIQVIKDGRARTNSRHSIRPRDKQGQKHL